MHARPLGQNTMMTEVPIIFRELSVYNQAECFLSPAGRDNFCVKLLLSNLSDRLQAKFWLVPIKLDYRKLTWFLFLKINIFLEKMWDVLKGSSTATPQLDQVTAPSATVLLVFTKRPQTQDAGSGSPGLWLALFIQYLVTADHSSSNRDPRWVCSGWKPALGRLK